MKQETDTPVLIEKYIQGTCSKEELARVLPILEDPYHNLNLRPVLYEIWNSKQEETRQQEAEVDFGAMLGNVHHRINLEKGKWNPGHNKWEKILSPLIKAAAILFIPLLAAGIWYFVSSRMPYNGTDSWITISSPQGSKIKTALPDGTTVWQNGGSIVKYPRNYTRANRQVILEGEAFFDVKSDRLHPFFVTAGNIRLKVTGTRFNVSNYEEDKNVSVVLELGSVFIEKVKMSKTGEPAYELTPGNQFCYKNETQKVTVKQVDVEKFTSWKDGKLVFRNDPLSNVAKRLKRWYNAEIELSDSTGTLRLLPFTLSIENETLPQVLDYLCQAAPLQYKTTFVKKDDGSGLYKTRYTIKSKN